MRHSPFLCLWAIFSLFVVTCLSNSLIDDRGNMIYFEDLDAQSLGTEWVESSSNWPGPLFWSINFYHPQTDAIYVLGGCTTETGSYDYYDQLPAHACVEANMVSAMWRFNLSSLQWTYLTSSDTSPTKFSNGDAIIDSSTGVVYLYLGVIESSSSGISVWKLDLNESSVGWSLICDGIAGGNPGTIGVPSAYIYPVDAQGACTWGTFVEDVFYLYVYGGTAPQYSTNYNDYVISTVLWRFNTVTFEWTRMSGRLSKNIDVQGSYDEDTWPGELSYCQGWNFPGESEFYLFAEGLFMSYDMDLDQWKFIEESDTATHGTFGVADDANYPGSATRTGITLDETKRQVFLLGGGVTSVQNELWKYDMDTSQFTWIFGLSSGHQENVVGTPGEVTTNITYPILGERAAPVFVADSLANLWVYGGSLASSTEVLSDLWVISRCVLEISTVNGNEELLQMPCDQDCGAGAYYSLVSDMCIGCSAGSWSTNGTTTCTDCATGKFGTVDNSTTEDDCHFCVAGRFEELEGSSSCSYCEEGTYSPDTGATTANVCLDCPAGSYNANEGGSSLSLDCVLCPAGTWSSSVGATTLNACFDCDAGFYSSEEGASSEEQCILCPYTKGLSCPQGSAQPYVDDGYWRSEEDPTSIFLCIPETACKSTGYGTTECASGFQGESCSECADNYYRLKASCTECPSEQLKWAAIVLFTLIAVYVLLRLSTPGRIAGVELRMMVFWLQIISLYASMSSDWPGELLDMFDAASFANANLNFVYSPYCSSTSVGYFDWIFIKLALTPAVLALLLVLYLLQRGVQLLLPNSTRTIFRLTFRDIITMGRVTDSGEKSKEDPFRHSRYIFAALTAVTVFYTMEVASLFEPFNCVKQDGVYVVHDEPSQECYTDEWYSNRPYLLGSGIFYLVIVPLVIASIIIRYRHNRERASLWFQARFSMLTYSYNKHHFWYELVAMAKRCLVVAAVDSAAYRLTQGMRVFVMLLLLLVFAVAEGLLDPFVDHGLYTHNLVWSATAVILLSTTLVYDSDDSSPDETDVLTICLIVGLIVIVCYSLLRFTRRVKFSSRAGEGEREKRFRSSRRKLDGFLEQFRSYATGWSLKGYMKNDLEGHRGHWKRIKEDAVRVQAQLNEVFQLLEVCEQGEELADGLGHPELLAVETDMVVTSGVISEEEDQSPEQDDWEDAWSDKHSRSYWYNTKTSVSSWENPKKSITSRSSRSGTVNSVGARKMT